MTTVIVLSNGYRVELDEKPHAGFVGIEAFDKFLLCRGQYGEPVVVNPEHVVLIYGRSPVSSDDNTKGEPLP